MDFKTQNIIDVIADVVDSLRESGVITSSSFDGTYTTVQGANNLKNYDVVLIGSNEYVVLERTPINFKVKGDATGNGTFKATAPYFAYGHIVEIAQELMKKDEATGTIKFKKYPIILLPLDVEGTYNRKLGTTDYNNITLIIANRTEPTYTAADRLEKSFKAILYPLYEELISALSRADGANNSNNVPFIDHMKVDRFFWGSQLNPQANVMNDHLDAIEIKNIEIRVINTKCN